MDFVNKVLFLFLALLASCSCHSFKLGGCPKVKVMKDFDMTKFLGEWFVVGRFNPLSTCVKIDVDKSEEGLLTVKESARPFGISLGFESIPRKGRKITILSNKTDAIFKVQQRFSNFGLQTFGVVDTDYTNYAVVWGCDSLVVGTVRNLDVLSRTPEVKIDLIKELADVAQEAGIDVRPLEKVDHRKCEKPEEGTHLKRDGLNNMFVEEKS